MDDEGAYYSLHSGAAVGLLFCGFRLENQRMDKNDIERRRAAWSSYWASGDLNSCLGSFVDDPQGAIGRFWESCFAGLEAGHRVLDLATGNGALVKLIHGHTRSNLQIDAVDLATVAPRWLVLANTAGVTFHSGVRMEALPFADAGYDLVVSQFGLEYAQWPRALEEAIRVCRPGGRMAFVLHHAESVVMRMGRTEQAHQRQLVSGHGLLTAARTLLPHLIRIQAGAQPGPDAERARAAYNHAIRLLADCISASETPDLLLEARDQVHGIVAGRHAEDASSRSAQLEAYAQALTDATLRTQELLECGLDRTRLGELVELLQTRCVGRHVSAMPLVQAEGVIAWGVSVG